MCQIAINIPNEVLYDTRMNLEETSQFVRCAVALGYYTQSGVSIGYCAQIAGLSKEEFIKYLGLSVTGTLGILLKAKKLGILKKLHPLLLHPLLLLSLIHI